MNPLHVLTSYCSEMYFNIIFQSTSVPSKRSLPFKLTNLNAVAPLLYPYVPYAQPISSSLILSPEQPTRWAVQNIKPHIMKFSPVPCHFLPPTSTYSTQHPNFQQAYLSLTNLNCWHSIQFIVHMCRVTCWFNATLAAVTLSLTFALLLLACSCFQSNYRISKCTAHVW